MLFTDIIKLCGLEPSQFRLARHGTREIDPLETFRSNPDRFTAYQAFQTKDRLGDAGFVASFAPYHGTQAIFLKAFRIQGKCVQNEAPLHMKSLVEDVAQKYGWWENDGVPKEGFYYDIAGVDVFDEFSERLVIEWGGAVTAWIQKRTDKTVVAILPPGAVREFKSFERAILSFDELQRIVKNPTNNQTWVQALKSVNGIYVIADKLNGRLYIGSAYGKNGIWGRWSSYAATEHGGNKMLQGLPSMEHMQFSILEILSGTSTAADAIKKETLWKLKLLTRNGGYNAN